MSTLEQILWAFIIGVAAAAVYTYYTKKILGGLVRKLFELEAFNEESAVTLGEVGCAKSFLLKYSLRDGTDFAETVKHIGDRYYIPEDMMEKAEAKYKGENITIFFVLIAVVAFAALALICVYIFPELIDMTGNVFD
jgi:hypothetical protein